MAQWYELISLFFIQFTYTAVEPKETEMPATII